MGLLARDHSVQILRVLQNLQPVLALVSQLVREQVQEQQLAQQVV
jgi:hypothetical protein